MKIIVHYFFRALGFPFFAAIALLGLIRWWFLFMFRYIKFGGEIISYTNGAKTIMDVYAEVQKLIKQK